MCPAKVRFIYIAALRSAIIVFSTNKNITFLSPLRLQILLSHTNIAVSVDFFIAVVLQEPSFLPLSESDRTPLTRSQTSMIQPTLCISTSTSTKDTAYLRSRPRLHPSRETKSPLLSLTASIETPLPQRDQPPLYLPRYV